MPVAELPAALALVLALGSARAWSGPWTGEWARAGEWARTEEVVVVVEIVAAGGRGEARRADTTRDLKRSLVPPPSKATQPSAAKARAKVPEHSRARAA